MSIAFRVLLVIVSLLTLVVMLRKIRKAQLQIEYALFWVIFCGILVVLSIIPEIAVKCSQILGLQSPSNLIFLAIIFILVIKLFGQTMEISKLDHRIQKLVQNEALKEKEQLDKNRE